MYPNYCSHCGKALPKKILASNLDNTYRDFYETGIEFEIECKACERCYTVTPTNQEEAIESHRKYYPYNENPKAT